MSTFADAAKIAAFRMTEAAAHFRAGDVRAGLERLANAVEPMATMAECLGEAGKTRALFVAGEVIQAMLPPIDQATRTHRQVWEAMQRMNVKAGTVIPTKTRRVAHELAQLARGAAPDSCLDRCGWVAGWLEYAAAGAALSPGEFQALVRQFRFIAHEIVMPDPPLFQELAEAMPVIAAAERELDQRLAAGSPAVDVAFLDAHPEIERQEFEFVRGQWTERRPRSVAS